MLSPAKICMNGLCGATTTPQWKKGWPLKAGGFASLCYACGTLYDEARYCERFHLNQPGWRECESCEKPIHCGCVVSNFLHECLDNGHGGIMCIKCVRSKGTQTLKQPIVSEFPNGFARFSSLWHPSIFSNQTSKNTNFDKGKLTELKEVLDSGSGCSSSKNAAPSVKNLFSLASFFPNQSPLAAAPDNNGKPNSGSKSMYEGSPQQPLGFASGLSSSSVLADVRVQSQIPIFRNEQKHRQVLQKPSKSGASVRSLANKGLGSDNRVARPPVEGRGRSQLLPRYWPKITDQELLQITGDLNSNCTITPLFEKVLSASDAGRIGRLVLPKACAEAYFPPIHQSEGLPIKIQDVKGKEWTFQFRFWPNNNSRMYVLENVTPCIQNMQLQAGDTVIFSRLDPDDKLVIGCRKATISAEMSALPNASNDGALTLYNGNSPTNMEQKGTANPDSQRAVAQEKKKARNIGSKSKRLRIHSEDADDLKFTWEEAQELFRPPVSKPAVVVIDDCELEEYDEPPVFGKKTSSIMKLAKSKKQKLAENRGTEEDQLESTGLDALATLAVLEVDDNDNGESLNGPTTKHPRHRVGCSCIVCIQPPSGKGKHKANCFCTVCSTVRRRFKTAMLRKRKRLSDRDGETARNTPVPEMGDGTGTEIEPVGEEGSSKRQELDLNRDPKEEEMMLAEAADDTVIPPEWQNVVAERCQRRR